MPERKNAPAVTVAGLALAATGVAHFVKPEAFQGITEGPFPRDTARHIYLNGGLETAIGLGLLSRRTQRAAGVGFLAYGAYLAVNVIRNS